MGTDDPPRRWRAPALAAALCAVAVAALLARSSPASHTATPSGDATTATCGETALRAANADLAPLLADLVTSPFFRFFKVRLDAPCPFWPDDGQCSLADCAVCPCGAGELPPRLAAQCAAGAGPSELGACAALGDADAATAPVDRGLGSPVEAARLVAVPGWRGYDNPWMAEADDAEKGDTAAVASSDDGDDDVFTPSSAYAVIDLTKNPERYTGYKGDHARRVWGFIYSQDCFPRGGEQAASSGATCDPAKAAFFRIMSGVHASITAHLADEYLVDASAGEWGPNLALFAERLGGAANAGRVANLHYAYAFVARAVHRAGPLLAASDYDDGGEGRGEGEAAAIKALVSSPALARVCGAPFDAALAGAPPSATATAALQAAFRNVTAAMDCVGCEKCRLWGKLQLLGVATALKVLVADARAETATPVDSLRPRGALVLERNEVVALINLFDRLARSVGVVARLQARLDAGEVPVAPVGEGRGGGHDQLASLIGF